MFETNHWNQLRGSPVEHSMPYCMSGDTATPDWISYSAVMHTVITQLQLIIDRLIFTLEVNCALAHNTTAAV